MVKYIQHIYRCFSSNDLFNNIIEGLNNLDKDFPNTTLDYLHPVDELHIRGDTATKKLI
ncbi:hypothetical protein [Candidatus Colwellia aromaticivorans]|uniref:hypothetical protein n=1 Tax=Candidatus Colwellia aromaticivorans TaxID=2267621 RepID=UPI00144477F6|nr:hypothetical protein [Candidatus Colwellia aromaticivorans]